MTRISAFTKTLATRLLPCALFLCGSLAAANAQGLNWEGQTGAFITPFAYTSASPKNGVGKPQVAFHYMNTGSVVGHDMMGSVTAGMFGRVELGYTRAFTAGGDTPGLSPLFDSGYNVFHGKVKLVRENAGAKWVPAVSAGFVARTNVNRVGGVLADQETKNGDVYVVATKTITKFKSLPVVVNFGVKQTNAALFGMAGNAPEWTTRSFGAVGVVVKGPKGSTLVLGSEFAQQPRYIQNLPGATLPTTLTYFARIIPNSDVPLNIDFGVAQAAGEIAPGVNVGARHQFAMGISYQF